MYSVTCFPVTREPVVTLIHVQGCRTLRHAPRHFCTNATLFIKSDKCTHLPKEQLVLVNRISSFERILEYSIGCDVFSVFNCNRNYSLQTYTVCKHALFKILKESFNFSAMNQSIYRSIDRSINQSINQSINTKELTLNRRGQHNTLKYKYRVHKIANKTEYLKS